MLLPGPLELPVDLKNVFRIGSLESGLVFILLQERNGLGQDIRSFMDLPVHKIQEFHHLESVEPIEEALSVSFRGSGM